jgi:hypothetical protein
LAGNRKSSNRVTAVVGEDFRAFNRAAAPSLLEAMGKR